METGLRVLLRLLFPPRFLDRHGPLILAACRAESRRPRNRGVVGRALFVHELAGDLLIAALRMRVRRWLEVAAAGPVAPAVPAGGLPIALVADPREVFMHPANDRLKRAAGNRFWLSLIVSTLAHAAVFSGFPTMSAAVEAPEDAHFTMVAPPEVDLPPTPEPIQVPATPVAAPDVATDVSISTTSELWDDLRTNPPPPPPARTEDRRPDVWTGPVQSPPHLTNRDEVARALEAHYPALLRDAGIGGRVLVAFFVTSDGSVFERRVAESSGHPKLDEAALGVADVMRFTPAMNREKAVAVWVTLPIEFTTRR